MLVILLALYCVCFPPLVDGRARPRLAPRLYQQPGHRPRIAPRNIGDTDYGFLSRNYGSNYTSWPNMTTLNEMKVLWDTSATSNRSRAMIDFFSAVGPEDALAASAQDGNQIFLNECFMQPDQNPKCKQNETQTYQEELQSLKSWMRSPSCTSSKNEYAAGPHSTASLLAGFITTIANEARCCDNCAVSGKNVDLYYWPDPMADVSCLSIVGEYNNSQASDAGATTDPYDGSTYWGCLITQVHAPSTRIRHIPPTGPGGPARKTTDFKAYTIDFTATTAKLTQVGPVWIKQYLSDPWAPDVCTGNGSGLPDPIVTSAAPETGVEVLRRQVQLTGDLSMTRNNLTSNGGISATTQARYFNKYNIRLNASAITTGTGLPSTVLFGSYTLSVSPLHVFQSTVLY